jgi:hypothetical protein
MAGPVALQIVDKAPFPAGKARAAADLAPGFETTGLATRVGLGVPKTLAERPCAAATRVFALPMEAKMACQPSCKGGGHGSTPIGCASVAKTLAGETPPDLCEALMSSRFFTVAAENDRHTRQLHRSAGLAVIHSGRNHPARWVQAGRACQRFALPATALGTRHAHRNHPVEVAQTRPQVQGLPGLGDRRPHLLPRFGYAPAKPRSLRRPVAAVIDAARPAADACYPVAGPAERVRRYSVRWR